MFVLEADDSVPFVECETVAFGPVTGVIAVGMTEKGVYLPSPLELESVEEPPEPPAAPAVLRSHSTLPLVSTRLRSVLAASFPGVLSFVTATYNGRDFYFVDAPRVPGLMDCSRSVTIPRSATRPMGVRIVMRDDIFPAQPFRLDEVWNSSVFFPEAFETDARQFLGDGLLLGSGSVVDLPARFGR